MIDAVELYLTGLILVSMVIYIIADYYHNQRLLNILKPLTMLLIIAIVLAGPAANNNYQVLIAAGLLFSLVGDCFLMLPGNKFLQGLFSFFIAHLFYITAFFLMDSGIANLLIGLLFALFASAIFWYLRKGFGALKPAVIAYMTIIVLMGWRAWEVSSADRGFNAFSRQRLEQLCL